MKRPRILLIKTHAIGDVLLITPAVRALRQRFPGAYLALDQYLLSSQEQIDPFRLRVVCLSGFEGNSFKQGSIRHQNPN